MKLKSIFKFIIFICISFIVYIYHNDISNYILENFVIDKNITLKDPNNYYKNRDYSYVQITNNFDPKNKQDLLNIFYTMLDNGWNDFSFYCNKNYETCLDDVKDLINDEYALSYINSIVNPYNSYEKLFLETSSLGKVKITIQKLYNDNEIDYINNELDKIIDEIIDDNMTQEEKIRTFHDYIINLIEYDKDYEFNKKNSISNKANGALLNKKAICSGYSDLMAIFLNKIGINNYKIISYEHVWNFVYLNDKWLHIDLTWDDPTTSNKEPILIHDYFLIDTKKLEDITNKIKDNQHIFNKDVYVEAK